MPIKVPVALAAGRNHLLHTFASEIEPPPPKSSPDPKVEPPSETALLGFQTLN